MKNLRFALGCPHPAVLLCVGIVCGSSAMGKVLPDPLRYGLYIHFDISTFTGYKPDEIGGIGTFPPERYAPTALDVRAWARMAKDAGMDFAVLTAKHEAGFCLWDSPDYDYDVGGSPVKTDVVAAFVAACQAEGIVPGAHYSIPDAHNEGKVLFKGNVSPLYFKLIKKQIGELVGRYPDLRILLVDVSTRLSKEQLVDLVDLVKKLNPRCRIWRSDYEKRAADLGPTYSSATVNKEWLWSPNGVLNTPKVLYDQFAKCVAQGHAFVRQVASYFIGTGPPLWLKRGVGQTRAEPVQGEFEEVWDGSLVVLISGKIAGAAELLASALASSGRAKLLGQRTSGTACLKELRKQPDGSSQKVLVAYFFSVRDDKIYGQGIEPDTALGLDLSSEAVLQKAVEVLSSLK